MIFYITLGKDYSQRQRKFTKHLCETPKQFSIVISIKNPVLSVNEKVCLYLNHCNIVLFGLLEKNIEMW